MEQQLRDAQYALAAADCAQLALMLSNERLRALCYADTLAALREEQAAVRGDTGGQQQQGPQQHGQADAGAGNGAAAPQQAGEPGSIAVAVERVRALCAARQHGEGMQPGGAALCGAYNMQRARGLDNTRVPACGARSLSWLTVHAHPFPHPPQFSRLHADMQEESRHDRAALQQLASSLASPTSIPLLK